MAEEGYMEIWNPATQRYEGFGFDPNSEFDKRRLKEAYEQAENRGRYIGGASNGQQPYLNDRPYEPDD